MNDVDAHGSALPEPRSGVEFRVLGPVEAVALGRNVPLGGPRQRTLLALLLLRPGRTVPAEELVDAIWSGEPPDGAPKTIRSYVSRLRATLGDAARIEASASGYAIDTAPDAIDAALFDRLVRAAETDLAQGNARGASEQLEWALGMWRGRAFGDLGDEGPLRVEAERLDALRLHAVEQRFEAELALGHASRVVDELGAAAAAHPYRERLWRLLMLALYHSGRQADALATYQRARRLLDEQLGIDPTPDLQTLEGQILRQEIPQVGGVERRDNLPSVQTSFVGRSDELEAIGRRLQEHRLITLTGVGGVGKTRLALEVARGSGRLTPDGTVFVDLASVTGDDDVARTAARTLGLREQSKAAAVDQVAHELRHARLVVVLDNCEHVRAGAAQLADTVLSGCRDVRILATSRIPLGVDGETEFAVAPLGTPPETASAEELRGSEAVRLLVERVGAVRPIGAYNDQALIEAARICRDLDGLPLAIELAAARAKVMSLNEIAGRLDDRFRFLVSWRRVAAGRHQTLKQAIDWSYDLLSSDDQRVFACLAVFAGGFTLDAAAHVCASGDGNVALDAMTRLVDASLVVAEPGSGAAESRYRLLETVRQYGDASLRQNGTIEDVRDVHATYFRRLAERAEPELSGANQAEWFARLDSEHANFAAALVHMTANHHDPESLLEFTVALTRFWYVRGHLTVARRALERALASSQSAPTPLRRRGLTAAASVTLLQGDYAESTRYAEESLEAARQTGEDRLVANGLSNLGAIVLAAGDHERAGRLLEEAVELARSVGDTRILALALNNLGDHALTVSEFERAEPLFLESHALLQQRGDTANVARSLFNLGAVALMTDRLAEADERLRASLVRSQEAGDKEDLAWSLLGLAALAAKRDRTEQAAQMLGAGTSLLADMGADFKPFERQLHAQTESAVVARLGEARYAELVQLGRKLATTDAVELATLP